MLTLDWLDLTVFVPSCLLWGYMNSFPSVWNHIESGFENLQGILCLFYRGQIALQSLSVNGWHWHDINTVSLDYCMKWNVNGLLLLLPISLPVLVFQSTATAVFVHMIGHFRALYGSELSLRQLAEDLLTLLWFLMRDSKYIVWPRKVPSNIVWSKKTFKPHPPPYGELFCLHVEKFCFCHSPPPLEFLLTLCGGGVGTFVFWNCTFHGDECLIETGS